MSGLLLLDLDDTLADREAAFLAWAEAKVWEWAPTDPGGGTSSHPPDCAPTRQPHGTSPPREMESRCWPVTAHRRCHTVGPYARAACSGS